ncbi:MAG: endonuclease [Nanoarchaeota archaeon]|nr:endonuclease [Nanoarchaeota archaeon]
MELSRIYFELLEKYSPQGWWPVTPVGGCQGKLPEAPIYGIKTKNHKQRLEIILGAILTQNTQWKPNVERAIINLNKLNLIDINQILKVNHEILADAIKSSGYYNQKAKTLKNMAEFLKKHSVQNLKSMDTAKARDLLLSINGIGPETADSILLYALDKPIFVIDAYTRRIFGRINNKEYSYDELQNLFHKNISPEFCNEYHALLVEHAKQHCKTKPICRDCPIKKFCSYA